ncbi:MAG: hypothetical protein KDD65_04525 [Bacteroidetes bacterium]|nr:hypothetical protein [Bacteroidota bacterium]
MRLLATILGTERRRRQQAARREVIAAFHSDPIAAYGLYELLLDSDLLSAGTQRLLMPYVQEVEHRMSLSDDELEIQLPIQITPITDGEYDTITAVIARALREFHDDLSNEADIRKLHAELRGVCDSLKRHQKHTASITYEIDPMELIRDVVGRFGKVRPRERKKIGPPLAVGDFAEMLNDNPIRRAFSQGLMNERDLGEGDIVVVDKLLESGYAVAKRIIGKSRYTVPWSIPKLNYNVSMNPNEVLLHRSEVRAIDVELPYRRLIDEFIELITIHIVDYSLDPARYQPRSQKP